MSAATFRKYPRIVTLITNASLQAALAFLSLCVIIFYSYTFYVYGWYDGIKVGREGSRYIVSRVDAGSGGEEAGVKIGDTVLAVGGHPIQERGKRPFTKPWMREGDILIYQLQRGDQELTLSVKLGSLSQDPHLAAVIGAHLLTAGFWAIGLLLTLFAPPDDIRARLIGLVWLLASMAMAAGEPGMCISSWGAYTALMASWCGLAFALPTAHLYFPVPSLPGQRRRITHAFAALALALIALLVSHEWFIKPYEFIPWGPRIQSAIHWFFLLSVLISLALLVRNRLFSQNLDARRQTGILMWGTALAFGPFFALTLLPLLLFGKPYVPGNATALFLVTMPLAYAYVIYQRKLLRVDLVINRIVVFFVLILLLFTTSILLLGLIALALDFSPSLSLAGGLLVSLVALPAAGLHRAVQTRVNRVLYGYHYDFPSVTASFSSRLARALERDELTSLLVGDLARQMAIEQASLFLADGDVLVQQRPGDERGAISLSDGLCQVLQDGRVPIRAARLWGLLSTATQARWERFDWAQLFVPIVFEGRLEGLLVLGRRAAGDVYSDQDMHIIATVAHQGALAYANVQLVERLRGLNQQLVRTDEAHRKRVARELHDTALQQIFFVKQALLRDPNHTDLVDLLDQTIDMLRQTIKAQRPPLLDQGLRMALQGLVEETQALAGACPVISCRSNVTGRLALSDEQATALYRIAQEALTNALKHAGAQSITVALDGKGNGVVGLDIEDDGVGISLPASGGWAKEHHYGLLGMQERAAMIGAQLGITSVPTGGTRITVQVA